VPLRNYTLTHSLIHIRAQRPMKGRWAPRLRSFGVWSSFTFTFTWCPWRAWWLVTGTSRWDHISPVLSQLHWLPVRQSVMSKIATLVHPSLSGNASGYLALADDCQLVADGRVRQLRSADTRTLVISRMRSSFGDRTFAAAGSHVWNSLSPNLRLCAVIRPVQAVTEDIFIRTVRPRGEFELF